MKLYTEDQVRFMLGVSENINMYENILTFDDVLKTQTPIELPSDELIVLNRWESFKEVHGLEYEEVSYVDGFTRGAKWMRSKIQ